MTSYKKIAEEAEQKLTDALAENAELKQRISFLEEGIIAEMGGALSDDDAKTVLTAFANRAKTKDELLLLIRTLTRI